MPSGTWFFDELGSIDDSELPEVADWLIRYGRSLPAYAQSIVPKEHALILGRWKSAATLLACRESRNGLSVEKSVTPRKLHGIVDRVANGSGIAFTVEPALAAAVDIAFRLEGRLRSVTVPFVAITPTSGYVWQLRLSLVPSGGMAMLDPRHIPSAVRIVSVSKMFAEKLRLAFEFNQHLAWEDAGLKTEDAEAFGIFWQVEHHPLSAAIRSSTQVDGRSAGLAAAVGIFHLLRDRYPDKRVIYSATIQQTRAGGFAIGNVQSATLEQKVKTIAAQQAFDTVVLHEASYADRSSRSFIRRHLTSNGIAVGLVDNAGNITQLPLT